MTTHKKYDDQKLQYDNQKNYKITLLIDIFDNNLF